jgi:hypothetical protein
MYFSRGELVFTANLKSKRPVYRSGLNATEVTSYQYLGMTKIAGALNMLPIEVTSRLKVLVILKEDLPLSLFLRKLL